MQFLAVISSNAESECAMKIEYEVTLDDAVAALKHYLQTSPLQRRATSWRWAFPVIVFGLLGLFSLLSLSLGPMIWGAGWLVFYAAIVLVQRAGRDRRLRRIYEEGKNKCLLGHHELELTADGLLERTTVSEGRVSWTGVEHVVSTETHTFVYTGSGSALIIPRATVITGDYRAFVATLREHFERTQRMFDSAPSGVSPRPSQVDVRPAVPTAAFQPLGGQASTPVRDAFSPPTQSGFGIASFVLGIVLFLGNALLFVAAVAQDSTGVADNESHGRFTTALAVALLGTGPLSIVGLVLGVPGLVQRSRSKVFPVLGICCNAVLLLGVIGFLLIAVYVRK